MTRIKIKCKGIQDKNKKNKLIEIICSNEIHITRIFTGNDGFTTLSINEEHADKIFTKEVKN